MSRLCGGSMMGCQPDFLGKLFNENSSLHEYIYDSKVAKMISHQTFVHVDIVESCCWGRSDSLLVAAGWRLSSISSSGIETKPDG